MLSRFGAQDEEAIKKWPGGCPAIATFKARDLFTAASR
jgi:hypothetical protein